MINKLTKGIFVNETLACKLGVFYSGLNLPHTSFKETEKERCRVSKKERGRDVGFPRKREGGMKGKSKRHICTCSLHLLLRHQFILLNPFNPISVANVINQWGLEI